MKTKKKLAVGCGSIIAIGIIGILSIFVVVKVNQQKYDAVAIPLVEEMMPDLTTWNYSKYKPYLASQTLEQLEDEKVEKLFGMYQRLGELVEYQRPQFQQVSVTTKNPYGKLIQYSFTAEFQNGLAAITLALVPTENDELKVWRLQINSDVFIVPLEEEKP